MSLKVDVAVGVLAQQPRRVRTILANEAPSRPTATIKHPAHPRGVVLIHLVNAPADLDGRAADPRA
jgi:hypothetical protein